MTGAAAASENAGVVAFKGRHFSGEVILWAVRWYLMFPMSYRDLELMLADRGVAVDHTAIFRWIQSYAAELEKRLRPHLRCCNGSWRVDETYVKIKVRWTYLYRSVERYGHAIDFLLSARRDAGAAKWFFRKALGQQHTVNGVAARFVQNCTLRRFSGQFGGPAAFLARRQQVCSATRLHPVSGAKPVRNP